MVDRWCRGCRRMFLVSGQRRRVDPRMSGAIGLRFEVKVAAGFACHRRLEISGLDRHGGGCDDVRVGATASPRLSAIFRPEYAGQSACAIWAESGSSTVNSASGKDRRYRRACSSVRLWVAVAHEQFRIFGGCQGGQAGGRASRPVNLAVFPFWLTKVKIHPSARAA